MEDTPRSDAGLDARATLKRKLPDLDCSSSPAGSPKRCAFKPPSMLLLESPRAAPVAQPSCAGLAIKAPRPSSPTASTSQTPRSARTPVAPSVFATEANAQPCTSALLQLDAEGSDEPFTPRAQSACTSIFTPDRQKRDNLPLWSPTAPSSPSNIQPLLSPKGTAPCASMEPAEGCKSPSAGYMLRVWTAMAAPYLSPMSPPAPRRPQLSLAQDLFGFSQPAGATPISPLKIPSSPRLTAYPSTPGKPSAVPFPLVPERGENLQRWLQQVVCRSDLTLESCAGESPAGVI